MIVRFFFAATGFIFSGGLIFLSYYSVVESRDMTWAAIYAVLALVLLIRSIFNLIQGVKMNRTGSPPTDDAPD